MPNNEAIESANLASNSGVDLLHRVHNVQKEALLEIVQYDDVCFRRFDLISYSGRLMLSVDIENERADSIQWFRGGEVLKGEVGNYIILSEMLPDDSDCYYALIEDKDGFKRTENAIVNVQDFPCLSSVSARGEICDSNDLVLGFVVDHKSGPFELHSVIFRVGSDFLKNYGIQPTVETFSTKLFRGSKEIVVQFMPQSQFDQSLLQRLGVSSVRTNCEPLMAKVDLQYGSYTLCVKSRENERGIVLLELFSNYI